MRVQEHRAVDRLDDALDAHDHPLRRLPNTVITPHLGYVTEEGYRRYNGVLDEREKLKMYSDKRAANYYRNEHGRSSTQCPFPTDVLWHWLIEPDYDEVVVR